MSTLQMKDIIEVMKTRRSTRKYKQDVTIPEQTVREILELATSAPSSWNLQHWKFIIVQKQENKEKLLPIAYNQQQVVDSSAVVIILGDTEAYRNAESVYTEAVQAGGMTEEAKNALINNIQNAYQTVENIGPHEAIRNASFAAMQLMLAAKAYGIDSCPMGGFNPIALREELNIPERYIPVLMLTLGYAKEAPHSSNRFSLDQLVIEERF